MPLKPTTTNILQVGNFIYFPKTTRAARQVRKKRSSNLELCSWRDLQRPESTESDLKFAESLSIKSSTLIKPTQESETAQNGVKLPKLSKLGILGEKGEKDGKLDRKLNNLEI